MSESFAEHRYYSLADDGEDPPTRPGNWDDASGDKPLARPAMLAQIPQLSWVRGGAGYFGPRGCFLYRRRCTCDARPRRTLSGISAFPFDPGVSEGGAVSCVPIGPLAARFVPRVAEQGDGLFPGPVLGRSAAAARLVRTSRLARRSRWRGPRVRR
jgi:hypothetical protein